MFNLINKKVISIFSLKSLFIFIYEMILILLTVTAMANGKEETMIVVYPENLNYKGRYCRNTIFRLIISAHTRMSEHLLLFGLFTL